MTFAENLSAGLAWFGVLASLAWITLFLLATWHRRRIRRLIHQPADEPPGGWPELALIFAARDEAVVIEPAVRSMLSQDYPNLKLIAVNDRSSDETGAILDRLALEDPRLRVVHVWTLPAGWLGKTHALHLAAEAAAAEWLLFTDADVMLAPDALRRAIHFAVVSGADHLIVPPAIPTETIGERLFLTMFVASFSFGFPIWQVENPNRRTAMGVGAFNLVRAERFQAIGGFRNLALSVDDDLQLGGALKASGGTLRVLLGAGAVSVRWQTGLGGLIRGLEKNFFSVTGYRLIGLPAFLLGFLWVGAGPHIGLIVGPDWVRVVSGLGLGAMAALVGLTGRQNGIGWYYALTMPISALLLCWSLLRSAYFAVRRQGIRWREHHYPLDALRTHVRHRDAWLSDLWRSTR